MRLRAARSLRSGPSRQCQVSAGPRAPLISIAIPNMMTLVQLGLTFVFTATLGFEGASSIGVASDDSVNPFFASIVR